MTGIPTWLRRAMQALIVVSGSGCVSLGTMRPARPLPVGKSAKSVEVGWMAGFAGYVARSYPSIPTQDTGPHLPSLEVAYRRGVTERVELGLRAGAGPLSLAAMSTVLLTPPDNKYIAVSLGPSARLRAHIWDLSLAPFCWGGCSRGESSIAYDLALPLLIGISLGNTRRELTLGPRLAMMGDLTSTARRQDPFLSYGGTVGVSLPVGSDPTSPIILVELGQLRPFETSLGGPAWQLGIGAIFP